VERQAGFCCHRARACHVFLVGLGTHMDVQFHIGHQRTEADSDDSQACQLPPSTSIQHMTNFKQSTVSYRLQQLIFMKCTRNE